MVCSPSYNNPTLYLYGIHHTGLRTKGAKVSIFPSSVHLSGFGLPTGEMTDAGSHTGMAAIALTSP